MGIEVVWRKSSCQFASLADLIGGEFTRALGAFEKAQWASMSDNRFHSLSASIVSR